MTKTHGHAEQEMHTSNPVGQSDPTEGAPTELPKRLTPRRLLVALGAAGPVLFLAVATMLGLLRPGYDAMSQHISELALGPLGWIQTASFYVTGVCFVAFALGFVLDFYPRLPSRSWIAKVLLGLTGILISISGTGLLLSGIFPTDAPGNPQTDTGALHNLAFLILLMSLTLAYPAAALAMRKVAGWGRYALATALMPVTVFGLVFVFVALASDPGDPLYSVGGLVQRILIVVAFGWITSTGWWLLRRPVEREQNAARTF